MAEAHVAECLCADPETHKDKGETITFREPDTIGFRELAEADRAVYIWRNAEDVDTTAGIMGRLSEFYLTNFITRWTLQGDDKKPLPVSPATVRASVLSHPMVALDLADVADELYAEVIFGPLVERVSRLAGTSQTDASDSPPEPPKALNREQRRASGRKGTRSKPSSTSTTPMAATTVTL